MVNTTTLCGIEVSNQIVTYYTSGCPLYFGDNYVRGTRQELPEEKFTEGMFFSNIPKLSKMTKKFKASVQSELPGLTPQRKNTPVELRANSIKQITKCKIWLRVLFSRDGTIQVICRTRYKNVNFKCRVIFFGFLSERRRNTDSKNRNTPDLRDDINRSGKIG